MEKYGEPVSMGICTWYQKLMWLIIVMLIAIGIGYCSQPNVSTANTQVTLSQQLEMLTEDDSPNVIEGNDESAWSKNRRAVVIIEDAE